ncbi:hypothetical protein [Chitinophaga sp. RAB17]|uniref:hypothetical protein n=1 Tax=Chitinophaga sp. RAB17 TaxID=3233049 RepID=UPI003F937FEE
MKTICFPWLWTCLFGCWLQACKTGQVINSTTLHITGDYCAPAAAYSHPASTPVSNTDSLLAAHKDMPPHEILMANATGTLALIQRLKTFVADSSVGGSMSRAEIRSQIHHRLLLATMEIAGVAAELDCEGERADQLARYLDNFNSKRNTRLTVASIIVGAITTIATVAIKNDGPQNAVAITGGLLSAGLGAMTINAARKKMTLTHERNVLHDIWYTPDTSAIYPSFTWYILTEKHFSNSGQFSLAVSIRKRWEKYDLGGPLSTSDEQLFFGSGGTYKADNLHTRASMLNELQSTVRSVNQDLQRFAQYLGTLE